VPAIDTSLASSSPDPEDPQDPRDYPSPPPPKTPGSYTILIALGALIEDPDRSKDGPPPKWGRQKADEGKVKEKSVEISKYNQIWS